MLTKICHKVISYTVMLICMSFISLGIVSKRLNFVFSCYFFSYKNIFKTLLHNQINEKINFFNLVYYIVFQLHSVKKLLIYF